MSTKEHRCYFCAEVGKHPVGGGIWVCLRHLAVLSHMRASPLKTIVEVVDRATGGWVCCLSCGHWITLISWFGTTRCPYVGEARECQSCRETDST
jgi:hypothetical protein